MIEDLRKLQKEAEHSYKIYIEISDILNTHEAKLSLIKWPDVVESALKCLENKTTKNYMSLYVDLKTVVLEPINTIFEATSDRVKDILGHGPEEYLSDYNYDFSTVIASKNTMINCINILLNEISEKVGQKYPEISKYDHSSN